MNVFPGSNRSVALALIVLVTAVAGFYFIPAASLLIVAIAIAIPCTTFAIECLAATNGRLPKTLMAQTDAPKPRYTVIVPAHNEAAIIETTLATLPAEATLVIADNCTDNTAELVRQAGFQVLERHGTSARGKGFAIEYGLQHLEADPPDIIVVVDADCCVAPGAISEIACRAYATNRPIQALYLLDRPASPSPKATVSALAFLIKNWVRPLGLARFGYPCLLQGTGMAFPWDAFTKARLVGDCLVEDMQQGIDLAIAGSSPLFCPQARVTGLLPTTDVAAKSQRTRWEHGHLETILTQAPRLLREAIVQQRLDLLMLALEVSVPPLTLLGMLWTTATGLTVVGALWTGFWLPVYVLGVQGALVGTAIFAAWAKFGREQISLASLVGLPLYLLWKLPLYVTFAFKRQKEWVRTPRDNAAEQEGTV